MRYIILFLLLLVTDAVDVITTIAGGGSSYTNGIQATSASLSSVAGIAVDSSGNVFCSEYNNGEVRKIDSTGTISTIAGTGSNSNGDGYSATSSSLDTPVGVAVDSSGNVYICDLMNFGIRKITKSTGIIYSLSPYLGCYGIKLDYTGNNAYIGGYYDGYVYKISSLSSSASTSIIAGIGWTSSGFAGDGGQATSAKLNDPRNVALDSTGTKLYIADTDNNRIRLVNMATGVITTVAGSTSSGLSGDNGEATSASLSGPYDVSLDSSGNIYIADTGNYRIRKVTIATSIITSIMTTYNPAGIALDSSGMLYVSCYYSEIYKYDISSGISSMLAGSYSTGYLDGKATSALFNNPVGIAVDSQGNIYIADSENNRIRYYYKSTDSVSTIAGGDGDGGQATSASFYYPEGVAVDSSGAVHIADTLHHKIRKVVLSTGIITSSAGIGTVGSSGDNGAATSAYLYYCSDVAFDSSNNMYIADQGNHRIRKVTASTGIISTIAGTGSSLGDGGQATSADLYSPEGVAVDLSGNVYIADYYHYRIRKVVYATGIISTIAGTGTTGYTGDGGIASSATLNRPTGVAIDPSGNTFIADYGNNVIRKITTSTGIINTVVGTGTSGYGGDFGQATSAKLSGPKKIAFDSIGNLYIADYGNGRVRKVIFNTISTYPTATPTVQPTRNPSATPTALPTRTPSTPTTCIPSAAPTVNPTLKPSFTPTTATPTVVPTVTPSTASPSNSPTRSPSTARPTISPTAIPTFKPGDPTVPPSRIPSVTPTFLPTCAPSFAPSDKPSVIPTAKPTNCPSITPTITPSLLPTVAPSIHPTYKTSVSVYFTAFQAFSGISYAQYNMNEVSNNGIIKKTVVDIIGYDIQENDLSISVSNYTSNSLVLRGLTATNLAVSLTYTVHAQSWVFNDVSMATASFITTLNVSIQSGLFDIKLHENSIAANNPALQSVTTKSIIINTASPTSSPTSTPTLPPSSMPTARPTKKDMITALLLDTPLNNKVTKAKVQYYLGTFVAYFFVIYLLLYLYSMVGYGKLTAKALYDSSHNSQIHIKTGLSKVIDQAIFNDLYKKNSLIKKTMKLEGELRLIRSSLQSDSSTTKGGDSVAKFSSGCCKYLQQLRLIRSSQQSDSSTTKGGDSVAKFSSGYRKYLQQRRTLLGCTPLLFPAGYTLHFPFEYKVTLSPGQIENAILYICHNHPLFSCFYFMDGSKLGAHGTRILYIGKDIVVFVLYQFSNMLLQYYNLDNRGLGTVVNLFIITPSAVFVGLLLKYLYICPFTETVEFQRRYSKYKSIIIFLGRLAIVPVMLIMCSALIIACLFSSSRQIALILINFFFFVQLYGIMIAFVKSALLFIDNYHYHLSFLGLVEVLCIGAWYKERIALEGLVLNVDYAHRMYTYIFGMFEVSIILSRESAIKSKWIVEPIDVSVSDVATVEELQRNNHQLEESDLSYSIYETKLHFEQPNPGTSMPTNLIFNTSSSSEYYDNDFSYHIENPLNKFRFNVDTGGDVVDDDAVLYEEYNIQQYSKSVGADDLLSDAKKKDIPSFEEWKINRKQFKQGTRGSFVQTFKLWEEREKVLGSNPPNDQNSSVKNTMHLYKNEIRNTLARKSNKI